ncbi:SMP-30/gluconolactonase/LRE family protein [Priestia aryabhattai]|uniref:SMP-30/gluconolactonase/LRE family protein n=1 Tax=Priestia TaxID=2800373 RepID=UPI001C8F1B1E|nr:SMP-30/gluconolactonase/LRE family protein [Priestia aryabhattai]MBX9966740.1 SMP-30/gluconolactonase/LRE family protein [Priestia aryabhattai]
MEAKIEKKYDGRLLEGPLWDEENQKLVLVDILDKKLLTYDPKTTTLEDIALPSVVTSVSKTNHSKLIVSTRNQLLLVDKNKKNHEEYIRLDTLEQTMRFNDGKCDPYNRFWVGTMSEEDEEGKAQLYVVDEKGVIKSAKEGLSVSNGLAWNRAGDKFFLVDSPKNKIMSYSFSKETTRLENEKVVIDLSNMDGFPDGMTIDEHDRLWVALWGGSKVICVDPDKGEIIESIHLPVSNVTCCTFGGDDLQTLFITTAKEEEKYEEAAGSLFSCRVGVKGVPAYTYVY